jgi:hypothetical protein
VTSAGQLRERFRFEVLAADANGDRVGPDWEVLLFARARLQYLHGSEAVMAARLEGEQPVIITVHSSAASRAVTTACRAVNHRTGQIYNIKGVELDEARAWVDVTAVSKAGGTVG